MVQCLWETLMNACTGFDRTINWRTTFCSAYNTGESVTTTRVSSEVDERQSIGRLASPLVVQRREASAVLARIFHSIGEKICLIHLTFRAWVRPVAIHPHKRKSSRHTSQQEKAYSLNCKQFEITVRFRTDKAAEGEETACGISYDITSC